MEAIGRAVTEGRAGDTEAARRTLLTLWPTLTDPLHRCTLAHHLADLYEDPAQALTWDIRALDAAADLTDRRLQDHHAGLRLAAFQPSLHLNLADDHRRLGSFDAAAEHIDAARAHVRELAEDAYGDLLRTAIEEVAEAISRRDTAKRGQAG
ncbi:hypothetical protein IAG44_12795 [Streptomyces roseirectus]|uniref:Tetratricopeptide repeat protein n=1 Tax=Streptomyces roseirectus TaxID=2768066 RepID=A0A7H0ISG0_9ACTN|nr:hypothetical protein [Streptomyces roseirectus]QNP75726.1 hypothetical protein IAG44_12795 [Streptomyces roseirectus]